MELHEKASMDFEILITPRELSITIQDKNFAHQCQPAAISEFTLKLNKGTARLLELNFSAASLLYE